MAAPLIIVFENGNLSHQNRYSSSQGVPRKPHLWYRYWVTRFLDCLVTGFCVTEKLHHLTPHQPTRNLSSFHLNILIMNKLSRFACTIFSMAATFAGNTQSNWSLVHTPTDPTEQYNGIHAITQNKVVLSSEGGRTYRSNNGCQTVDLYQVPGNYPIWGDINFADAQNGFIGGGCWFPFGDCISSAMLRTTDGGATWSVQQLGNNIGVLWRLMLCRTERFLP